MKTLWVFLMTTTLLSAFEYGLKPEKVNDNVYCFFGKPEVMNTQNNGNMVNSCFVDLGEKWLVIDPGPTFAYAKEAWSKISAIKKMPVASVINTHVHDDHWLGNGFYKELGIKIIGSAAFKDEPKVEMTRMQMRISKEAFSKTTQEFPTIFVEDEKILNIDGKTVHLINVNKKAHTDSDLLVYIPEDKTIFVGDLVFNDRLPSIRDGNLKGWIESLDEIRSMDVLFVIGGHGKIVDKSSIDMTYNYIKTLRDRVATLLEDGEDIGDVVNMVEMKEYKNVNFYDSMHRQNVEIAYRMLEWGSE